MCGGVYIHGHQVPDLTLVCEGQLPKSEGEAGEAGCQGSLYRAHARPPHCTDRAPTCVLCLSCVPPAVRTGGQVCAAGAAGPGGAEGHL